MSNEVADVLRRARARIGSYKRFCRTATAKDQHGYGINPEDARAVQWCGFGAVFAETPRGFSTDTRQLVFDALNRAAVAMGHKDYLYLNGDAAHADVLRCFDAAIADAEATR